VDIGAIRDHIAHVDADAKTDRLIWRLVAITGRHLLLHLHCATHCPVNAVEHHKQRTAAGADDPAAVFVDRRVYQVFAERAEPFKGSNVIRSNQAAVTNHVGMEDGNQLPRPWRPSGRVRCLGPRHNGQPPVSHRIAHRRAAYERSPQPE
jgi:hypothetical protein